MYITLILGCLIGALAFMVYMAFGGPMKVNAQLEVATPET